MTLCFVLLSDVFFTYQYLLQAAVILTAIGAGILLFSLFFLSRYGKRQKQKKHLRLLFSDLIAGIAICDNEEERTETLEAFNKEQGLLLQKPFVRKVLIREIITIKDSINGHSADNVRWLYETLRLDVDTMRKFTSRHWHRKASAIQQLAEMQQTRYLIKIYRETNNPNRFIRTEAQIAVVKLTGFKGLRFLNIVTHPVSQWQQLSLISHLQEGDIEEERIRQWILSPNQTVCEFGLRLVEIFKCHALHDDVMEKVVHTSPTVRRQALKAVHEIYNDTTVAALVNHFPQVGHEEQLMILDMLTEIGAGKEEISFFTSLLEHEAETIRYSAIRNIQQLSPAWSTVVMGSVKDNPSFSNILSMLQKEAV